MLFFSAYNIQVKEPPLGRKSLNRRLFLTKSSNGLVSNFFVRLMKFSLILIFIDKVFNNQNAIIMSSSVLAVRLDMESVNGVD